MDDDAILLAILLKHRIDIAKFCDFYNTTGGCIDTSLDLTLYEYNFIVNAFRRKGLIK